MSRPSCPACSTSVDDSHRFCPGCGVSLDVDSPTGTAPRRTRGLAQAPTPGRQGAPVLSVLTPPAGTRGSDERFTPGTVILGRYRVVGLLGRGGMGEVYRADDLKLEQPVALKFLPRLLEGNPERLERLYAEVRMARQVSHPHVCRVWDVGETEGQHFLSMEFVDGENLASLLRRIGRLPGDKALEIAGQVAEGLAAAHAKGVLHRDLKPANVMLDGQGQVRLTDFGLAALADALSAEDVRSGTPPYMSPEQLQGREVTARSDIYAFGLLLYELFTGRRAFEGRGVAELLQKHRDERPLEPSVIVPDITPAVERTILACLEKEPKRRPPSALAVAAMLKGRDPLEAVIAAGETPSPELVAAAGDREVIRPRVAAAFLALVTAAILAVPFLQQPLHILSRVPVEKTPAALEDRAREMLNGLGHAVSAADFETGFLVDDEYFRQVGQTDRARDRWRRLASGEPPVLSFWYRQSPRPLFAAKPSGRVYWRDPPLDVSGMAGVRYDMTGRLLAMSAVPPQLEPEAAPPAAAVDWRPLLAAARLDAERLKAVSPRWTPPFHTDTRVAWEGTWPQQPDVPIRVEAAAYRGRPVWFQVLSPWTRAERDTQFALTYGEHVTRSIFIVLLLALVAAGAVLAKRNMLMGRGDRHGAFRLGLVLTGLGVAAAFLGAHHVADPMLELVLLARSGGLALLVSALVWLFYLALEPYVRRLRPWTLVSWTRLLNGGYRDAVVGRDVLIGMGWGVAVSLFLPLCLHAARWIGHPEPAPPWQLLDTLLGTRSLLAYALTIPVNATLLGLALLLMFLLLRFVTRRDLPAAALVVAVLTATAVGDSPESKLLAGCIGALLYSSLMLLLLRVGVLAAISALFTVDLLSGPPHSLDLGSWTGSATAVIVPLLLVLAVAAYRSATGGHLGLRRYLAGEPSSSGA